MVACHPFLKVIDQLVTPTPKMILLWWWTKGYPMKTHEILTATYRWPRQQTTLKSYKHILFNTINYICYMFNTKILQLILFCSTDILCNRWPLGEILPNKEISFVTWNHVYYHIFYKNNCNHKPTYNKSTAQHVITWEYITYFTLILVCSVLTHATSSH